MASGQWGLSSETHALSSPLPVGIPPPCRPQLKRPIYSGINHSSLSSTTLPLRHYLHFCPFASPGVYCPYICVCQLQWTIGFSQTGPMEIPLILSAHVVSSMSECFE